jgi:putative FmdB family regulatory protein
MASLELYCRECKRTFQLQAATRLKDEEKNCPECGSDDVRQTLSSYLRSGPLLDMKWTCSTGTRGFG